MVGVAAPVRQERVGGVSEARPSHFAAGGRLVLAPAARVVRQFSSATGELLASLTGHEDRVTGVTGSPGNAAQIVSASLDATLRVWDILDGRCLRTLHIDSPIKLLANIDGGYVSNAKKSQSCVYIVTMPSPAGISRVIAVDLMSGKKFNLFKAKGVNGISVSRCGRTIAVVANKQLLVWEKKISDKSSEFDFSGTLHRHLHSCNLHTVAIHPYDPYVATGDRDGRIVLWFKCSTTKPVVSILHWHAHTVGALAFSEDGAYLLSGGEEAVLVIWQLESGHRQFLPRLGAPIVAISISPSGNEYALTCADNTIRILDAVSSRVVCQIRGLMFSGSIPGQKRIPCLLAVDPRTGLLALNGSPGSIQFYDPLAERHVFEVDAVERNFISRMDSAPIATTKVEKFAFSRDARWMALALHRHDGDHAQTICLHFWKYDPSLQKLVLAARVDSPHKNNITSLSFHPSENKVITTASNDLAFKVWTLFENDVEPVVARLGQVKQPEPAGPPFGWKIHATVRYRQLPPRDACYSSDGSLIAVAHGHLLSLWNADTLELRGTLSDPPIGEAVLGLRFVPMSPFILSWTSSRLNIWNLLSAQVWWSLDIQVAGVAVEPDGSRFAIISCSKGDASDENAVVSLFAPDSPEPLLEFPAHGIMGPSTKELTPSGICFMKQRGQDAVSLAYMNAAREVIYVEDPFGVRQDPVRQPNMQMLDYSPHQKLQKLFGVSHGIDLSIQPAVVDNLSVPAATAMKSRLSLREMVDGPTHLLPSVSTMFSAFIDAMVLPSNGETPSDQRCRLVVPRVESDVEVSAESTDAIVDVKSTFSSVLQLIKTRTEECFVATPPRKRSRVDEETPLRRTKKEVRSESTASRKQSRIQQGPSTARITRSRTRRKPLLGE